MKTILIALSLASYGQPTVDLSTTACPGDPSKPRITAMLPATVAGGGQVLVPVCLQLGAGLKINMDATVGPAIEATVMASPPALRMIQERVPLETVPTSQETLPYTLASTPAPNTLVTAFYKGGAWWNNQFDVVAPVAGRALSIALPRWRAPQPGEVVVVVYWTTDPLPIQSVKP